jgi:transcriptional regulator with XRE-family HTH domain
MSCIHTTKIGRLGNYAARIEVIIASELVSEGATCMSNDAAATFARRLREERERAGVSQAEVARRVSEYLGIDLSPIAITKVESRARSVKIEEAVAMAEALKVPLTGLLADRDALEAEVLRAREQLMVTEHARADALSKAAEYGFQIESLRGYLSDLEASRGD